MSFKDYLGNYYSIKLIILFKSNSPIQFPAKVVIEIRKAINVRKIQYLDFV